jgi:archaellin
MKKLLLALPVLALLSACPQIQPQANPLTVEDAKNLKTIAPLAMNGFANSVRSGGSAAAGTAKFGMQPQTTAMGLQPQTTAMGLQPQAALGLRPQNVTGNCGPNTTPTDADNDKIPANFSYIYDCTVTIGAGFKFLAKGQLSTTDASDQDANSGYSSTGNIRYDFIFTNTETKETSSFSFVVQWTASAVLAGNGGYTINTDQRITFQPDSDKSQFAYQLSATYTPDNDGNTQKFDAGTINLLGSANFRDAKGRFSIFNLSATNLHFGNSCPRAIDSGSLRIEDSSNLGANKNNVLLLTANGCDLWSATYNGSAIF